MSSLLSIKNLAVHIPQRDRDISILRNINMEIQPNEFVGLVGESGSGKSILSFALMGLLPLQAKLTAKSLNFRGQDLLNLNSKQKRNIYGSQISMIFQDANAALNPVMTVEQQIAEVFEVHTKFSASEIRKEVIQVLEKVKIPNPEKKMKSYPHELSGGLAQRVMIAMAIALKPALLIADEPTTALDVTIQSEVLDLMLGLQKENQMSILFISHDLALVSKYAQRVFVIYAGEMMENGLTKDVIHRPKHPYTEGLLHCLPANYPVFSPDFRLPTIPGQILQNAHLELKCLFVERCKYAQAQCRVQRPVGNPQCFFPLIVNPKP
jgi:dipeptide transport system ATP-binding protein